MTTGASVDLSVIRDNLPTVRPPVRSLRLGRAEERAPRAFSGVRLVRFGGVI